MFRAEEHKSNDDCYFYYYSTCKKGDSCLFRHCEAALGTEMVCPEWQVGKCFRPSCPYRHMESAKDRSAIPCYWENQPGGCRKPHCVFRHYKKENIEDAISKKENLILPVSTNDWQSEDNPNAAFSRNASLISRTATQVDAEEEPETALLLPPAVEPLVVSFDGESDSESCTSTPVKPPIVERKVQFKSDDCDSEPLLIKTTKNNKESMENLDFGIKTLQQIREEKDEKDDVKTDAIVETEIKASPVTEKKTSPRRRRTKRKIHLASTLGNKEELDFKVKTLDEIRKERFSKSETSETELQENLTDSKENNNENRNQRRHIILRREKNLNSTENEKKEINIIKLHKSSQENEGNETVAPVEKISPKQKRTAREIYQPPKAQKNEESNSVSPKKKVDKKESLDNICIKTLAEIREERRLKQLQETGIVDCSLNQVSSSTSMNTINTNAGTEETNSRKHKMEISTSAPLNKKIRLNTSKFSVGHDSNSPTGDSVQNSPSADKEKSNATKRKLIKEEANNSVLNTAVSPSTEEKLHPLSKIHSPAIGKKRKLDIPNIIGNESRSPKNIAPVIARENLARPPPSNEAEDEFDLLLDEEDDEDVDLNVADVKDDDLLLELEEMINS